MNILTYEFNERWLTPWPIASDETRYRKGPSSKNCLCETIGLVCGNATNGLWTLRLDKFHSSKSKSSQNGTTRTVPHDA